MANKCKDSTNDLVSWDLNSKCNAIINWAKYRPNFNIDFVQSVLESDDPSEYMMEGVDNIIKRFRITSKWLD